MGNFQIFDPFIFTLFAPKVTWLRSRVSRFNLHFSLTNLLFSSTLKMLIMNAGFSLFTVLFVSTHKILRFSFSPFLLFSNKPS